VSEYLATSVGHKKLDTLRCHMVKTVVTVLPGLDSVPGRDTRTDRRIGGRTDRITTASTR